MNSEDFISIIKKIVRDSAIETTIDNLEHPPGRKISDSEKLRSVWFNNLTEGEKNSVVSIINDSVNEAVFGFLSVIDGVRAIEDDQQKGRLVLTYNNVILNDSEEIYLHDLYNSEN